MAFGHRIHRSLRETRLREIVAFLAAGSFVCRSGKRSLAVRFVTAPAFTAAVEHLGRYRRELARGAKRRGVAVAMAAIALSRSCHGARRCTKKMAAETRISGWRVWMQSRRLMAFRGAGGVSKAPLVFGVARQAPFALDFGVTLVATAFRG